MNSGERRGSHELMVKADEYETDGLAKLVAVFDGMAFLVDYDYAKGKGGSLRLKADLYVQSSLYK